MVNSEINWNDVIQSDKPMKIIISSDDKVEFLKILGNDIDENNFIVDSETCERVKTLDNNNIKIDNLGAVATGSKVFIKDNYASFYDFLSLKRK